MKQKIISLLTAAALLLACSATACAADSVHTVVLNSTQNLDGTYTHTAKVDGKTVTEYDYTWHADPGETHNEVKNQPAEYYTGTKPSSEEAVYIAHDIFYYPELPEDGFKKVNYDGEQEWAYYYTDGKNNDYIFATLPVSGSGVPTQMMHSPEDAYQNAVLHITEPGTYSLTGSWHGQIWIDLGDRDETFADESAKVQILLNGVDVTCTVAPALVFYSAYECDNTWEERDTYTAVVDTADAGASVVIADGTVNNFNGTNVFRMLKTKYKDENSTAAVKTQKKARKTDGAFYSYVSMNIEGGRRGTGVLNITGGFEGLDSELHLTLNGGNVNIFSQDDGSNVNEDGVSVLTVNGGSLHILAGLGREGDGIDSNGFITVNGGTVISIANPGSDSGMDSDSGTYVNGGTVLALGSTMDWARADGSADEGQAVMNLQFSESQSSDEAIIITDTDGKVVFAYDPDKDEVAGSNARMYRGAVVSAPGLTVGSSYYVYVGGDVTGRETAGVYDVSTVTGFTDDARKQCYTGTGTFGGHGGGMRPGDFDPGMRPEDFDPDRMPGQRPESMERQDWMEGGKFDPAQMGSMEPPELPEGFDPSQMMGQRPAGMERPQDMMGGDRFGGQSQPAAEEDIQVQFRMESKVNGFSGVRDFSATGFADVAEEDWFRDAVAFVSDAGLMKGVTETLFRPDGTVSRGMLTEILYRMAGSPAVTGTTVFPDVSAEAYYSNAAIWAAENGIVKGYEDGSFRPNQAVSRQQTAALLYRYAVNCGMDVSVGEDTNILSYDDVFTVSEYAIPALQWACGAGVIRGDQNCLRPAAAATRAQIAVMLMRACENTAA